MKLVIMSVSLANQKIYIKNKHFIAFGVCAVAQLQNKQTNQKSKKATWDSNKTTCKFSVNALFKQQMDSCY